MDDAKKNNDNAIYFPTEKTVSQSCTLCRYMRGRPWEDSCGYYCVCEDSPHFGTIISDGGQEKGPGCEHYAKGRYRKNDMELEEALKIISDPFLSAGALFDHALTLDRQPMIALWFKTNEDLENWRDAHIRIFAEVMEIKRKNGEFVED